MDLKQISYILTIAKTGTVTQAARKIHISQSALSQSYRNLEQELGLTPFVKNGRSLELTEDGAFFCERGAELLNHAEEFQNMLKQRRFQHLQKMNYYTNVVDNCDETILQYQAFFPDIQFERIYGTTEQAVSALKNGSLDFALTLLKIEDPQLCSECLIDEPVVILVSQDSRFAKLSSIRIAELDGETLTIYQNAEDLKNLFLWFFAQAKAAPSRILQLYDPVIQIQRNTGFIFMPQSTYRCFKTRHMLPNCKGILVEDSFCRRRVFLNYSRKRSPGPVCQAYFSYLRDYHALSKKESCLPEQERFAVSGEYRLTVR